MDAEKRSMGISDYSGDRKGGRGGPMSYRPAVSKEAVPGDSGSYYDKVTPPPYWRLSFVSPSTLDGILFFFTLLCILLWFDFVLLVCPIPPPTTCHAHSSSPLNLVFHWLVPVTVVSFDQSGLVPWRGGSLLSVLTNHCLPAPFPLQPHYSL